MSCSFSFHFIASNRFVPLRYAHILKLHIHELACTYYMSHSKYYNWFLWGVVLPIYIYTYYITDIWESIIMGYTIDSTASKIGWDTCILSWLNWIGNHLLTSSFLMNITFRRYITSSWFHSLLVETVDPGLTPRT